MLCCHREGWIGFVLWFGFASGSLGADEFDLYLNRTLSKALASKNVREVKQITSDDLLEFDRVLPNITSTFVIVKTNEGRNCKLLLQEAGQKIDADRILPMLLVDRYVTYREGEEQTILASGKNVALFPGFRLSLDRGQVVPEILGGDVRVVSEGKQLRLEPVGKARLFLVTKALPNLEPPMGTKFVIGDTFEAKYFNGTYKLYDDGRRSGRLVLKVHPDNRVTGALYSSKDGSKYDVRGKLGSPLHSIEFTVQFPRTIQTFRGWLFTKDARVLTGWATMSKRESGFYAVRVEE